MKQFDSFERLADVMVPMRDGVKLATDIYLPASGGRAVEGPFPTVLVRTPYDKTRVSDHASIVRVRDYAYHGYAVVVQDCRGRSNSEGEFYPFVNETWDGHDTLVWIGQQPWCNGKVGTIGTSYNAQTQSSLATTNPPYLASQFVSQGYSNYHRTRTRTNGVFNLHRLEWFLRMAVSSPEAERDPVRRAAVQDMRDHMFELFRDAYPLRRGETALAEFPSYERAYFDFMCRGDYDEFWEDPGLNLQPHFERYKDVPITWLGGWYDGYSVDTCDNYEAMVKLKKSEQRLIMGPWAHGMAAEGKSFAGQVSFGEHAAFDSFEERVRWLDYTLKGEDYGQSKQAPVRIFVMGGGSGKVLSGPRYDHLPPGTVDHGGYWRDEQEWPLARERRVPHYFHAGGGLSTEKPAGVTPPTTYDFDPRNPVPTLSEPGKQWHESGGPFLRAGVAFDQRDHAGNQHGMNHLPLAFRKDVVSFRTPPLAEDVEVTGWPEVVLYISSSAPDTDFTAMLIDQYPRSEDYPEGFALKLGFMIQRCRYRNGYEKQEFMQPGEVYQLRFRLPPTSNVFKAGHRIRVDISSSNWPEWEVNPNTGEPLGQSRRIAIATNSIYHDEEHPSHVILPIIPAP